MKKSMCIRGLLSAGLIAIGGIWQVSPAVAAPSTNACDVAREYVRLIAAKQYDEVGELWAEDAVFDNPMGVVIRGKAQIKAFYSTFLNKITPTNRIASLTFDPKVNRCVMELETRVVKSATGEWKPDNSGEFQHTAVDLFTVNAQGKVQHMRVYTAPSNPWLK